MPNFEELELRIKKLSLEEKKFLAKYVSPSEIESIFNNMKDAIAQEAKLRTQSKIATTFNKGYGTGALFNSIFFSVEGDDIKISSTKNYFNILNQGFGSFDMKKAFAGGNVKMRLPGGQIIYRKAGLPDSGPNPTKRNRPGSQGTRNNFIHPGYKGVHIEQSVNDEMEEFIFNYVHETVERLLQIAKSRNQEALANFSP